MGTVQGSGKTGQLTDRLRAARANMLGTDDEDLYFACHEAAGEIERLRSALLGMMQRCKFHDGEQKTDSGLGAYLKAKAVLEGKHS